MSLRVQSLAITRNVTLTGDDVVEAMQGASDQEIAELIDVVAAVLNRDDMNVAHPDELEFIRRDVAGVAGFVSADSAEIIRQLLAAIDEG